MSNPAPNPFLRAWNSPGLLLLAVGLLLGLNFPLGKLAVGAGIPPIVWAAVISTGGAVILGLAVPLLKVRARIDARHLRYFAVIAVISYALPNVLVYSLIPKLGSGYVAILFTLSPMFTVVLSFAARLRHPSRLELLGIAVGFAGALLVATSRGEIGQRVDWIWVLLGICVPLSLAIGNVYRTLDWPKESSPLWLAVGSNAISALLLIAASLLVSGPGAVDHLLNVPGIVAIQVALSAAMFALFFRLQAIGGPVTLSQIGTVAAGVGVIIGTFGLGERYSLVVWSGVALIAIGIGLTLRARLRG
jgi:drug/metabolite transporter (DMT)-like permease